MSSLIPLLLYLWSVCVFFCCKMLPQRLFPCTKRSEQEREKIFQSRFLIMLSSSHSVKLYRHLLSNFCFADTRRSKLLLQRATVNPCVCLVQFLTEMCVFFLRQTKKLFLFLCEWVCRSIRARPSKQSKYRYFWLQTWLLACFSSLKKWLDHNKFKFIAINKSDVYKGKTIS